MTESELNAIINRAIVLGMKPGPMRDLVESIGYVALEPWEQGEIEQLKQDIREQMRGQRP